MVKFSMEITLSQAIMRAANSSMSSLILNSLICLASIPNSFSKDFGAERDHIANLLVLYWGHAEYLRAD